MSLGILDDNNLGVALRLQLEELEQLRGGRKGKHRVGEAPDFDIAADLYKAELSSYAALVSDRAMCKSIARAVNRDAELIRDALQADEQVRRDREIALRLSAGGESKERTPFAPAQPSSPAEDEALIKKLEALYMFDEDDTQPESSSWAASRPRTKATKAPLVTCTCCGDAYATHDVARCPCSHEYCRECLETLFKNSLVDESLFPPRCCHQPIPLEDNRAFLSAKLVGEFQAKRVELETVNRTYCHRPACSTFVPIQFIRDDVATCVRCRTKTCTICKGAGHQGDCPQDTGTQELLRVAEENGWKRCYACRRLVELDHGCNHMTCRCGAQFCYVCGERWKTCPCAQWDEQRLVTRANVLVDRNHGDQELDDRRRENLLERERRNLVQNHECEHDGWRSRQGHHRCEECRAVMPMFIYECRQCQILACRRCRFNRL